MFTGIVKGIGKITQVEQTKDNYRLTISDSSLSFQPGDSVSVDGICLTVVENSNNDFQVEVMPETVKRTNIKQLKLSDEVNLEPALGVSDRLDGHFVLGHVDTTGILLAKEVNKNAYLLTFSIDPGYSKYLVEKGSIAIDGVSLTIISITEKSFQVGIIPYTSKETILGSLQVKQIVNLEVDILGKYILKLGLRGSLNVK
ncbi:riboflavin synthase [Companilactobacillus musae]|uniref:riboflavin synthase n=1 Tax=Companilactobacillus musae TaxID=1903258 RepID=UPI000E65D444|nr:riboflavin synthase [Companilactobacillus musae]